MDRVPDDLAIPCRTGTLAAPARINSSPRPASQKHLFCFSELLTLLPAREFQAIHLQSLAHSLQYDQKISPVFPAPSALFLRSVASVQVSTALFSHACALFCKNTGGRGTLHFRSFNSPHFCALQIAPRALCEESHHEQRGSARLHLRQSHPCRPNKPRPGTAQVAK
jgi:hypothetical protein